MKTQRALLMAMMEPLPEMEGEFQEWYNFEHQPGVNHLPGFITANRLVCVEGWPRYAAMYDIESTDVLTSPGYLAVGGKNTSPWSRRIRSKVHGYYRAIGVQIYPGTAVFGEKGLCSRIALLRFNAPPESTVPELLAGLRALFEERPETAQVRLFRSDFGGQYYIGMVESRRPINLADMDVARFGDAAKYLDLVNVYVPYFRMGATAPGSS